MVFVKRNADGQIVALSREPQIPGRGMQWEALRDDDPQVLGFASSLSGRPEGAAGSGAFLQMAQGGDSVDPPPRAHEVSASDAALIRVIEDLVDVLIGRGVIRFTDLPAPARAKLTQRRHWRAEMRKLTLLDDESDVI